MSERPRKVVKLSILIDSTAFDSKFYVHVHTSTSVALPPLFKYCYSYNFDFFSMTPLGKERLLNASINISIIHVFGFRDNKPKNPLASIIGKKK